MLFIAFVTTFVAILAISYILAKKETIRKLEKRYGKIEVKESELNKRQTEINIKQRKIESFQKKYGNLIEKDKILIEIESKIQEDRKTLKKYGNLIEKDKILIEIESKIQEDRRTLAEIKDEITLLTFRLQELEEQDFLVSHGFYESKYDFGTSEAYKEKEEQRRLKEQMREEEKARREIEKIKEKAEEKEEKYTKALEKARQEIAKLMGQEKDKLQEKIEYLGKQLEEATTNKERAVSRAQLTKSGHVYIISNIGSFGSNIYKIGMTRRLDPNDRVKELSSASVPFPFDVHAMIFSDNAPELENKLHQIFDEKKVNKANDRKEFFAVALDEIIETVKDIAREENWDTKISFTKVAEAEEYRKTVAMKK